MKQMIKRVENDIRILKGWIDAKPEIEFNFDEQWKKNINKLELLFADEEVMAVLLGTAKAGGKVKNENGDVLDEFEYFTTNNLIWDLKNKLKVFETGFLCENTNYYNLITTEFAEELKQKILNELQFTIQKKYGFKTKIINLDWKLVDKDKAFVLEYFFEKDANIIEMVVQTILLDQMIAFAVIKGNIELCGGISLRNREVSRATYNDKKIMKELLQKYPFVEKINFNENEAAKEIEDVIEAYELGTSKVNEFKYFYSISYHEENNQRMIQCLATIPNIELAKKLGELIDQNTFSSIVEEFEKEWKCGILLINAVNDALEGKYDWDYENLPTYMVIFITSATIDIERVIKSFYEFDKLIKDEIQKHC